METINERALTNQAPLPNQSDCGGRLEARPISQPRCQRTAAEGGYSVVNGYVCASFLLSGRRHSTQRIACIRKLIMVVWLASYPRSGNTFLRIVLHRLYGVPTYSVYDDDDPVAQRVGPDLVGYRPKPLDRAAMRESAEVFFTKTHKRRKGDGYRAIYLVRDGRDAVVSKAHLRASEQRLAAGEDYQKRFAEFLRAE